MPEPSDSSLIPKYIMSWITCPIAQLGFVFFVLTLVYFYGTKTHGYWKKRGIPFVPPTPFFGNIFSSFIGRRAQGQIVTDIYLKYPNEKAVGMWNLGAPALVVRDPELVHRILVSQFENFQNNEIEVDPKVDPTLASNMFCQRGEIWKRSRQLLCPAFTTAEVKASYDKIRLVSKKFAEYIEEHPGELQLKDLMSLYTSDVVASWGLAMDGKSLTTKDPIIPKLGKLIFDPNFFRGMVLTVTFLAPSIAKIFKLRAVPGDISDFFEEHLRRVLKERETTGEIHTDFLQYFINMKKNSSNDVTDEDVLAGLITFFIEGYETSSMVSSFLLYHLAMNPDIQDRLRKEVETAIGEKRGDLTYDAIVGMKYMEQCFAETNRMHAVLLNLSKVCTSRCTLDKGIVIEPDTTVIIPVLGLHMDPKYWDDPETFNPDRFSEDNMQKRRKDVYLPFGLGPRDCIGGEITHAMVKTAIADILLKFEIRPSRRTPPKYVQSPNHFMSCQEGGLFAQFVKR